MHRRPRSKTSVRYTEEGSDGGKRSILLGQSKGYKNTMAVVGLVRFLESPSETLRIRS